jgi:TatD DNase family protein
MIDVHCHLNFHSFADDYDFVIKQALDAGVSRIINVGTKLDSSKWAVDLAEKYDALYAIVGVHPHHADKVELNQEARRLDHHNSFSADWGSGSPHDGIPDLFDFTQDKQDRNDNQIWIKQLEEFAKHPKVVGIGEVGMDYYSYQSNGIVDPGVQREIFEAQIDLAYRAKLPLQIHNRHAGEDVISILKENKHKLLSIPGMFHCFAGSMDVLKDVLDLGFFVGFDGNITYKGLAPGESVSLRDLAAYTPLDRLVVETDSPYLTPLPHRGKRNTPSYVIITARYIAQLKNVPYEEFVEQTTKNVYTIFTKLK